jgi:hypothetical protein
MVFLVLTISPLIYFGRIAKRRSLRAKKQLETYAELQGSTIDEIEHWNDKAIGIDKGKKQLYFTSLQQQNEQRLMLDIHSIKSCSVSLKKTSIDLLLEYKHAQQHIERIRIYNVDFDDANESGFHHQVAIRWAKKISEMIDRKKRTPLRKSA